jgi:hypothetical protein
MNTKRYLLMIVGLAAAGSLALAMTASAAAPTAVNGQWRGGMRLGQIPGVVGTVSAVNGNTITVTGKAGFKSTTATTYTVDATNAKVTKNNAAGTVSSIAVGDMISVQGTVNGTDVTATAIRDGQFGKGFKGGVKGQMPAFQGNGQPVVVGKIATINGTTLTITNNGNVSYMIDAASAKITQGQNTINAGDLKVGDTVIAQGTVNGTSVTAVSVIDQTRPAGATANSGKAPKALRGLFGSIGLFFQHLFGL